MNKHNFDSFLFLITNLKHNHEKMTYRGVVSVGSMGFKELTDF